MEIDAELNALSHEIIGAAIEVHRVLGPGFLEGVYEEALERELQLRNIPCRRQVPVSVSYKGNPVGEGRLDLLIDECLPLELKAVETLMPVRTAQIISYLKAAQYPLGLFINFNVLILKNGIRRVMLSDSHRTVQISDE